MGVLHFIVKYVLFILNLIFTILGMAIVVLGVLIHFNYQNIFNSYPDDITIDVELEGSFQMLSIAIIVLGSVLFLIAFSGCCGAVTETKCLLVMYAVVMFLLLAAKIYLSIVWTSESNAFRLKVKEFVYDAFDESNPNVTFHIMEATFHCCGTTGPESYEILPPTCCGVTEITNVTIVESECLVEDAFSIGCVELVDNFIADIVHTVKTVLIWVIVFEALEFIGAVYLCTSITKRRHKLIQY